MKVKDSNKLKIHTTKYNFVHTCMSQTVNIFISHPTKDCIFSVSNRIFFIKWSVTGDRGFSAVQNALSYTLTVIHTRESLAIVYRLYMPHLSTFYGKLVINHS